MGLRPNTRRRTAVLRNGSAGILSPFAGIRARCILACAGICAAFLISASAQAWTIDFEDSFLDLANPVVAGRSQGRIIDDEFAMPGLIDPAAIDHDPTLAASFAGFRHDGAANPLVLFDTASPTGGDYDLGAPFTHVDTGEVLNPGRVLILHENPTYCRKANGRRINGNRSQAVSCDNPDDRADGGQFQIEFNKAVTLRSIDFFDIEYDETLPPDPNNGITLYDVNGDQIVGVGSFFTPSTGGDNKWKQALFNVAGVARIRIKCAGSCALDNIRGGPDSAPPPPADVSEPSIISLFAAGLIGGGWYRRKKANA